MAGKSVETWQSQGHSEKCGLVTQSCAVCACVCVCVCVCVWMGQPNKNRHYKIKEWHMPENWVPGEKCVRNRPIVNKNNILLPPLHIKLGLVKNFVKPMNKQGKGFEFLRKKHPKLCDSELKEGIFFWPQIREIINDDLQYKNTCWRKQRNLYGWHYKWFV